MKHEVILLHKICAHRIDLEQTPSVSSVGSGSYLRHVQNFTKLFHIDSEVPGVSPRPKLLAHGTQYPTGTVGYL